VGRSGKTGETAGGETQGGLNKVLKRAVPGKWKVENERGKWGQRHWGQRGRLKRQKTTTHGTGVK